MTNKEKFIQLVSGEDSKTLTDLKKRIKNREMLRESQQIALKVLMKLDNLGWSQKDLAKKMEVTPQQITKIVSGKENLTIETQIKLQNILDVDVEVDVDTELEQFIEECDNNQIEDCLELMNDLIKEYSHLPGVSELINVLHKHKPN